MHHEESVLGEGYQGLLCSGFNYPPSTSPTCMNVFSSFKVVLEGRQLGQVVTGAPFAANKVLQHRAAIQKGNRQICSQVIAGVLAYH